MIEVIKTNPTGIPVGTQFILDEDGRYSSYEIHEDIGDDYEFSRSSLFGFSPSFYEANKEIFTEIKIEETNEKNEMGSGPESQETESKSEDVCNESKAVYGRNVGTCGDINIQLQREEVEESSCEGKGERECIREGRPDKDELYERFAEADRKEDSRIIEGPSIETEMYDLLTFISMYRTSIENKIYRLRDLLEPQYINLK